MASKQEPTISLKYWVDEEKNRVIVAEASGEFIDVLFSFLTLPLGTITRLVTKHQPHDDHDQPLKIGCINNLYHSVETFETNVFWNNICQKMLLSPRNPLEASCQRLKVKVDDTEHTRYFVCASCLKIGDTLVSTFAGASCNRCGKIMSKQVQLFVDPKDEVDWGNGVFVKRDAMFFIFDDLRVLQSSPGNTVHQLLKLGYNDFNKLTEKSLNFGMKEMFSILKKALTSKTPLSDVLLANRESETMYSLFSPNFGLSQHRCAVKLKLTVSKSQNKILFAEAEGDFMDFLFSFLTIPLGSILNLMNGKLSLGSIDNLYQSVKKLNSSWFIGSSNNSLLNPRVPPQFGCINQPLNVVEQNPPSYWYGSKEIKGIKREVISRSKDMIQDAIALKLFDPRCSDGARGPAVGFMKRPCLFVVRDDLQVTPMTTTSSINFVHDLGVPLDDFEEYSVEIKNSQQALNLLGFSLTSKAALTKSLFHVVKTRKCVMSILRCPGWRKERQGMKERHEKKKEKEEEKILKSDDKEKEDMEERKETEGEKTSHS